MWKQLRKWAFDSVINENTTQFSLSRAAVIISEVSHSTRCLELRHIIIPACTLCPLYDPQHMLHLIIRFLLHNHINLHLIFLHLMICLSSSNHPMNGEIYVGLPKSYQENK